MTQAPSEAVEATIAVKETAAAKAESTFLDVYRDFFRNYTDSPPIFCEAIGLNLLSLAVDRIPINLKPIVYPNVWTLLIGDSWLTRKSTAINALPVPKELRMPFSFSPEGLESSLKEFNSQGLIYKDEVAGFLRAIKSKEYMKEMAEMLSFMYNCPEHYSRKLRNVEFNVENVCLNILGGTQPVALQNKEVAEIEDFQTGFLSRFMIVYGSRDERKPRERWTEDDTSRKRLCEQKWQQIFDFCHSEAWSHSLKFDFEDNALESYNKFEAEKDQVVSKMKDPKLGSIKGALLRGVCDYSIKLSALNEIDHQFGVSKLATVPSDYTIWISIDSVEKSINTMLNLDSLLTANLLILLTPELVSNELANELQKLAKFFGRYADTEGWMNLKHSLWLHYSPWRDATALSALFDLANQHHWFIYDSTSSPSKAKLNTGSMN